MHLTRRAFAGSSLVAGFTLWAQPRIALSAIVTPADGLVTAEVEIPAGDGTHFPAYVARPEGEGPFATMLVVHEIFGVHEYVRDVCRRLALQGFAAIAPDLYRRQGDIAAAGGRDEIFAIVGKVPDAQVMSDLDDTLGWAAAEGLSDGGRVGITGFCWGGRIAWLYAAHTPVLKAAVAWYGRLDGDRDPARTPSYPVDVADHLLAPVLGLYGGADHGIGPDQIAAMRAHLEAAGAKAEIVVFDGAGHGFHADYRDSYDEAAATEAWAKMLDFVKDKGVSP